MNIIKKYNVESFILLVISHLVFTVLAQMIFYFFNFGFTQYLIFIALIPYIYFEKYFFGKDNSLLRIFISFFLYIILFFALLSYFSIFLDHSFDGNMYHGEVMIQLIYGWNPIYNSNVYIDSYGMVWGNLYPKFSWVIGSFFIDLTKKSSAGMILNGLIAVIAYIKTYKFSKHYLCKWLSFTVATIAILNPIFIEQIHTLYVDSTIYNFLLILIIFNLEIMDNYDFYKQIMIVFITIALINLKFSSFAFAGFIDLSAFIYFLIKDRKKALKIFLSGIVAIIIGVGIIGYSPYIINILEKRNIFFPLMGKDKWDVVTSLILEPLEKLRSYERFFYSITNGLYLDSLFNFDSWGYMLYDQRIGGFGFNFFKLSLISAISILVYLWKFKKIQLQYLIIMLLFFISVMANYRNIWWARYAPHLWIIVPLIIFVLNSLFQKKIIIKNITTFIVFSLVLQQSYDIYKYTLERDLFVTKQATDVYDKYIGVSDVILTVIPRTTRSFITFEEYKEKEYGLDVSINLSDDPQYVLDCTQLEVYTICISDISKD